MPNDDSDLLRPDFHFSNEVLTRSRSTWSAVASAAQSATNLPSACCNVKAFLNKTPSIPESSGATDRIGSNSLYTQGYVSWSVTPTGSQDVYIGESKPSTCNLSSEYIPEWSGFHPLPDPVSNYLAAQCDCHEQDQTDTPITDGSYIIDIGTDDFAEVQWWAAILAEGRGCSPFRLHHRAHLPSAISPINLEPLSSAQAQEYLFNLARYHDAFDQLISALAATMTIPLHNRTQPHLAPEHRVNVSKPIPTPAEIPHYMALSCTSGVITSCLFSCSWELDIPCNLVSQWLNPPMREIFPSLFQSKNCHAIVCAMAQRRPNIAPLWLGSLTTGLLPRIFQVCRSHLPTVYLEAVTWTASPQSFMDPQYHRLVPLHKNNGLELIPREDEFHLLFITGVDSETYISPPLSPYRPFGLVELQNTSIDVRLHCACNHQPSYYCWNWKCEGEKVFHDFGMSRGSKASSLVIPAWAPIYRKTCFHPPREGSDEEEGFDDRLSELATRNIFSWIFFTEGTRPEERELWKHEWLELLVDRDYGVESSESSSSEVEEGGANSENLRYVHMWRDNVLAPSV
ncbi:hypothetical protein BDV32DRAFT_156218 [Aspergillus pseudonomiae]|nr:hypothetical protein BDV32DRAFT_156218 [Aspergillus pseudonomiae]